MQGEVENRPTMNEPGPKPGWERREIAFASGAERAAEMLLTRIAKVEAVIRLLYPDDITPAGKRILERALTEGEAVSPKSDARPRGEN